MFSEPRDKWLMTVREMNMQRILNTDLVSADAYFV